jgi:ribosomal protein S12 methylthiotransferase accessory factor
LTEAAQSRLTYIAGTRDDIPRSVYRLTLTGQRRSAFQPSARGAAREYRSAPTLSGRSFGTQLRDVVERIRAVTGMSPVAVDLTRRDFGVPVLFVIAPGLGARASI